MTEVNVYDKDLQMVGIIDTFASLIWANRYWENGDCELYLPATMQNLNMLQIGYFLGRNDDDMICRINYIELDTSAENGNYLIVKGIDVKSVLDQRIVWTMQNANGNAEVFLRSLVDGALGNTDASRMLTDTHGNRIFYLGAINNFTDKLTEQVTYKNLGDKCREYCRRFGWGYKVTENFGSLYFRLFKGTDRSNSVVFSNEYENLAESVYVDDETNIGNVALIGGEGEGSERVLRPAGTATSFDRHELFVDAKDVSSTITYKDLITAYPNGSATRTLETWFYTMTPLDILVMDPAQLAWLQAAYSNGYTVTIDGNLYYEVPSADIAVLPSHYPADTDNVKIIPAIYYTLLLSRGFDKMSEYGAVKSFDGSIQPDVTFVYKQDYYLGDIVTVENEYGISVQARITDVVEVWDENGYSCQPVFEYIAKE